MRIVTYIFILLVILFGISFAVLNSEAVTVNYYFNQSSLPLSLLIVFVFAFGCLIGIFGCLTVIIKSKLYQRRLKQRLHLAEREIENLRAIPLQDKV